MKSLGEETLALHIRADKLPPPEREYIFDTTGRKWRLDFAWPEFMLAVEVEGGTWGKSRHTTGKGFRADIHKYNAVNMNGWTLLRFTTDMVKDGTAIALIKQAIDDTPRERGRKRVHEPDDWR